MSTGPEIDLGEEFSVDEKEILARAQAKLDARRRENGAAAVFLPPPAHCLRPPPIGAPGDLAAPLQRAIAGAVRQHAANVNDPTARARRERLEAMHRDRQRRELFGLADDRGVPAHPAIRAVVAADRPPLVEAFGVVEDALAWRQEQRRPGYAPPPLTLVLAGPPGCGKTTTLARIVARWPTSARYTLAREVATIPENAWEGNKLEWRALASIPLLAIDEAGLEESDRAGARLGALLAERIDGPRVTLIATNLGAEAFSVRYMNGRLHSRLSVEQGRRGCPWWRDLEPVDYRDPEAVAALEGAL